MNTNWLGRLLLPLALAGCSFNSAAPVIVEGLFDIGGFRLYLQCRGSQDDPVSGPTVLLEHGIGTRATSEMWTEVAERLSSTVRVCRYDRAGVGKSDPPLTTQRSGAELVSEHRRLLSAAEIEGPYLLVGHSFGGFPVRLFAHQHPSDVIGLVLVDTPHEEMILEIPLEPEDIDAPSIQASLAAQNGLGDLPIAVIKRGRGTTERWEAYQLQLSKLSTNSRITTAKHSDHQIPMNQPEIIVQVVNKMLTDWTSDRGKSN